MRERTPGMCPTSNPIYSLLPNKMLFHEDLSLSLTFPQACGLIELLAWDSCLILLQLLLDICIFSSTKEPPKVPSSSIREQNGG